MRKSAPAKQVVKKPTKFEEESDEESESEVESEEEEQFECEIPADKYYSLNKQPVKKAAKKVVKAVPKKAKSIKLPPKPKVTIDYNELKGGKYHHGINNIESSDELLYNKACANLDNVQTHVQTLFKLRKELSDTKGLTAQKHKKNEQEINGIEADLLQLNRLARYYDSIIKLVESKYE